jgi:hypothetical protein
MTRNWDQRGSATDRDTVVVSSGKVVALRAAFGDTESALAFRIAALSHAIRSSNGAGFGGNTFRVTRDVFAQDIAASPQQTGATSVPHGPDGAALPVVAAVALAILQGRDL